MEKIEEKFREIDKLFDKLSAKNKVQLENAQIKPIHAKYPFAQNGICAFIAPMGSGKSYNYMKLAAQQEVLNDEPFFELIVICSTSAKFDQTVQTFLPSIKKSKIVSVKDTELLDWLNKYMRRILKYNSINEYINTNCKNINEELMRLIMKHNLANKKPKVMKYIINKLMKYNWRTFPHRCLLILDDFANHALLRSKETDLSRLLKKLRHFHINVMICVQVEKYKNPRGGQYQAGCYPVSANVLFGKDVQALPDGRYSNAPLADGVSPRQGHDVKGPTAAGNSVAKLDQLNISNGTLYNQKFLPSAVAGDQGLLNFAAVVRNYFDKKGMHVQFNVIDKETLLDAQAHPENYKDLVVRVAGYSAHWTVLAKEVQDDIIARTEQSF